MWRMRFFFHFASATLPQVFTWFQSIGESSKLYMRFDKAEMRSSDIFEILAANVTYKRYEFATHVRHCPFWVLMNVHFLSPTEYKSTNTQPLVFYALRLRQQQHVTSIHKPTRAPINKRFGNNKLPP